jgi:hypothetical protein
MLKPNYKNDSIVNLMSSIGRSLGHKSKYNPLKLLPPSELKSSKNIVLMLIDGLGYEFLMKHGKGTVFNKNIKGKITSVFPTSTSAAIPAIATGQSPREHGMTGWHLYSKELETTIVPLPYISKSSRESVNDLIELKNLFYFKPFSNKIKSKPYIIFEHEIINSNFTKAIAGKAQRLGFKTTTGYFNAIKKIINTKKGRKYIYAYFSKLDSLSHHHGTRSKKVQDNFKDLNKKLKSFLKSIEGTNTTLIITADHGHINASKKKTINLKHHPKLKETLTIPLCGEHRFAYCYVKPSKESQFKKYIKTKLKHYCYLYKSEDLVKKGYFGLGETHPKFLDRIGDYTLIMKENYMIYDFPEHIKKEHFHISDHGGLSKEELFVPLIVIKT